MYHRTSCSLHWSHPFWKIFGMQFSAVSRKFKFCQNFSTLEALWLTLQEKAPSDLSCSICWRRLFSAFSFNMWRKNETETSDAIYALTWTLVVGCHRYSETTGCFSWILRKGQDHYCMKDLWGVFHLSFCWNETLLWSFAQPNIHGIELLILTSLQNKSMSSQHYHR